MPDAPEPVTSAPKTADQPWDATAKGTVAGWQDVESGPADASGHATADFEDGPGPWKQTLSNA